MDNRNREDIVILNMQDQVHVQAGTAATSTTAVLKATSKDIFPVETR